MAVVEISHQEVIEVLIISAKEGNTTLIFPSYVAVIGIVGKKEEDYEAII